MKLALEEWHHWLEGATHPFIVLTDHKNLEYLRSAKRLNPRQARWALFFTRFRFTVTYRPGTKNTKADALSCQTEKVNQTNNNDNIIPKKIIVAPVQWDIMTEIEQLNLQNSPPVDRTYVLPVFTLLSDLGLFARYSDRLLPALTWIVFIGL